MRALATVLLCGSVTSSAGACAARAPTTPATRASSPLEPIAWLAGDWQQPQQPGNALHCHLAGDALFCVGFQDASWDVRIIHTAKDRLVMRVFLEGVTGLVADETGRGNGSIRFAAGPTSFHYERIGADRLGAIYAAGGDQAPIERELQRIEPVRATTLEQADLDFAADTAARAVEGWVEWFDERGAMWRDGEAGQPGQRVEGHEAVRALMSPVLARPGFELEWKPIASGLAPTDDLGYTVGSYEAVYTSAAGAREVRGTGAYVTIWKKQPDGRWRVLFDTGDPAE